MIKLRIVPDAVYAYEKIPVKDIAFTIIEGNDICKIVMMKILVVDFKDVVVRTENDIDIAELTDLTLRDHLEPSVVQGSALELKLDIFVIISDHKLNLKSPQI